MVNIGVDDQNFPFRAFYDVTQLHIGIMLRTSRKEVLLFPSNYFFACSFRSSRVCRLQELLWSLVVCRYLIPSRIKIPPDPHGEYGPAFSGIAEVFRIGDAHAPLVLPYWAMSFDELAWFFVDRRTGTESPQDAALREKVFEMKKAAAGKLKAGAVPESEITADSPIPFDIRQLWYEFDTKERATFKTNACVPGEEELEKQGDATNLTPAKFKPVALGGGSPFRNKAAIGIMPQMNRLAARLRDKRFESRHVRSLVMMRCTL